MTKKQIREVIEQDWIEDMVDMSKGAAYRYIESFPDGVFLGIRYEYEGMYGQLCTLREETDEEEASREASDKITQENYDRRAQEQRDREATQRALNYSGDKVMAEYNEKHKDNPRVGDMCNLYKMILNLEIEGKSVTVLRECLDAMERG